jgi:hypothetical protein
MAQAHAQVIEPLDSPYGRWVSGLVLTSVVIGLLTILMSLSEGTIAKGLPFGIASLVVAVAARMVAGATSSHRAAANTALVIGLVALASGLQSALIGTGQIS